MQQTSRSVQLKAELERIRSILAGQPSIRRVLLFGSVSAGRTHEWSDLDLAVIEESEASFIDRSLRLARLVQPRVGVQFLVYTPAEMQLMAQRPFGRFELLAKGKVLPMNPSLEARRWLEFARQDLQMADLAMSSGIFNQVCFHAQQCAEKCLSACLAAQGELLPRTHLIADLFDQLPQAARAVVNDLESDLVALDQFYIPTRYPDALPGSLPEGLPGPTHADIALGSARRCYQNVQEWVERT